MRRLAFGFVVIAACGTTSAQPQPPPPGLPSPRIQTVFPPGAKAGPAPEVRCLGMVFKLDSVVTVTGTDLEEPEKLYFSHSGIRGEYIAPPAPPPDPKKKETSPPKPNPGPHKFRVTVDASVPPGTYDVRFAGRWGVSNPRAFVVGNLNETNEKEPNNDVPEAQRVEIGTTINGVLAALTDVDYSVFAGKKGQRVVLACLSSSIDGRASPLVEVYDAAGRKISLNHGYNDNDAVTDVILPTDGDYFVRVSPFAYQGGGPDHFYRLTISTGPWIDAVFPPAVEPGKPTPITLYGRNLPNSQPANGFTVDGRPLEKLTVTVTPPAEALAATKLALRGRIDPGTALQDGFEYVFKGPNGTSNCVPIYFARDKLVVKKNAGGSTPASAEAIPAPCEVAGFIGRRGDSDWYSFDAKKGDQYTIEVVAERAGTSADFFISVRDGKDPKKDLSGELDDDNETLHPLGFFTRTTDPPPYKFAAAEDGKFLVMVGCRESSVLYGPRTSYRLRVSPAKPDFRAVVLPFSRHFQTGSSAWQGGNQAYDVYLHRIDGYAGSVTVTAEGLPVGVTAKPITLGPAARWGVLVVDAAPTAAAFTGTFTLKATGTAPGGKSLIRDVRPASVTWGVNAQQNPSPVIGRLDQSLVLAVRPEKAFFTMTPDLASAVTKVNMKDEKLVAPLTLKQGEKFTMPVKVNWLAADKQPVTITAEPVAQNQQSNPVTVQIPTQPTKEKPEAVVNFDVKSNALPGTYTIALKGVAQVPFARPGPDGKMAKGPNVPAEVLGEPILVTVIPSSLATVTPGAIANNTLKLGSSGEMVVKVERKYRLRRRVQGKVHAADGRDRSDGRGSGHSGREGRSETGYPGRGRRQARPGHRRGHHGHRRLRQEAHHHARGEGHLHLGEVMRFSMRSSMLLASIAFVALAPAQEPKKDKDYPPIPTVDLKRTTPVEYGADIEPIFKNKCFVCHTGNVTDTNGKFDMSTYEKLMKGGAKRMNKVIVPGKSAESFLFQACSRQIKPIMPPKTEDPLSSQELSLVKLWIDEGAKAPTTMRLKEKIVVNLPPALVKPVRAVAVAPNGKHVAASRGNQVNVFEVKDPPDAKKGDAKKDWVFEKPLLDPQLKTPDGKAAKAAHISLVESMAFSPGRQDARDRQLPGSDALGLREGRAEGAHRRLRGQSYLHRVFARRQVLRHRRRRADRGRRDQGLRCNRQARFRDQGRALGHRLRRRVQPGRMVSGDVRGRQVREGLRTPARRLRLAIRSRPEVAAIRQGVRGAHAPRHGRRLDAGREETRLVRRGQHREGLGLRERARKFATCRDTRNK